MVLLEQVTESLPVGLSESTTYPDGEALTSVTWKIVDDCRVCMRGTLGLKCSPRATCPRPVCVMTDGTTLASGQTVDTAWCHTCSCDARGNLSCVRRTDADCPADRCAFSLFGQAIDVPVGGDVFTGECVVLRCDATTGAAQSDICHPECLTHLGTYVPIDAVGLDVDGCAICTCNYGAWCCDRHAQCPATQNDPACPGPGECTTPTGDTVRGGTYFDFGNGKTCVCGDNAWTSCVCNGNPC